MLWLLLMLELMVLALLGMLMYFLYEQTQILLRLQQALSPWMGTEKRMDVPVVPPGTIIALSDEEEAARERSMRKSSQQWAGWPKGTTPNPPPRRRQELLR